MPQWVEVRPSGHLAIVVDARADALLIRYATGGATHYHWVGRDTCRPRPDLAHAMEPAWLIQARASARPPRILWSLLHEDGPAAPSSPSSREPMFDTDADGRPLS